MKALLMAAGVGNRISRHLHGQPKCCVEVGGTPLIRYTFDLLARKGIRDIALVTGYQERHILQALEGMAFRRYFNPFFRVTNSIASVWMAREFLASETDLVIMNADVFVEDSVVDTLLTEQRSPVVIADSSRIQDADYRLSWSDGLLRRYGKELTDEETTGEYVGICTLNRRYVGVFKQMMIEWINQEDYNCWWEDVIYRTVESGAKVHIQDIAGQFWAEVDYIEDYQRITDFVAGNGTVSAPPHSC
ncbi:phosphocholine cytidylyltransferase family protein [Thiorhodovibrio frisius]|uniref:Putative sugar nucleotidyltransferase n=1 Tax=Thiorhodovibrio frisius TaxID=631362 RepID=H8YYB0_9GAMM|nr:phosphocholine cytidylyltransferase family protein [Thiorhodovibrio frisius]EIC23436.1 putative sugar nucleotidyltransferase [Thiorhodovibrio frisius]WPL23483.1 Glucose-1-phosphate cytidylyltransferase [Thiorhodovibrio frisius]